MRVTIDMDDEQLKEMLTTHLAQRNVKYLGHEFVDDNQLKVYAELLAVSPLQQLPQAPAPAVLVQQLPPAPREHPRAQSTAVPQPVPEQSATGARSIVAPDRSNLRNGDSGGPRLSLTDMHDVPPPSASKGEVLSHKQDIHETALAKRGGTPAPLEEMSVDMRLDDGESEVAGDEDDNGDFSEILAQMRNLPDNPRKGSGT